MPRVFSCGENGDKSHIQAGRAPTENTLEIVMSMRTLAATAFAAALILALGGIANAAGSSHSGGTKLGANPHAVANSNGRHSLDRDKGLARADDRRDRHGHDRDHDRKHKIKTGMKPRPSALAPVKRN